MKILVITSLLRLSAVALTLVFVSFAGPASRAQSPGGFVVEFPDGRTVDVWQSYTDCMDQFGRRDFAAAYVSCRVASDFIPLRPSIRFETEEESARINQLLVYSKTAYGLASFDIGMQEPRNVEMILDARREFNEALGIAFDVFPECDDVVFALHENISVAYSAAGLYDEAYAVSLSAMGLAGQCRARMTPQPQ